MLHRMILLFAGMAVVGAALAAPAPSTRSTGAARGSVGTLNRSPAPAARSMGAQRGGPGTLGRFLQRPPSSDRFPRAHPYYLDPYYRDRYSNGFYYSPFLYDPFLGDPFYTDGWGSYSMPGYAPGEAWSQRGNVELHVDPKDVEVIVDGIPTARSGRAALNLPTGVHHIEVLKPGYRPWTLDLDVQQGVRYRLDQRLERLSKEEQARGADRPSTAGVGELRLNIRPSDAIVDLDGRLLGMADLLRDSKALRDIPLGRHTLRISRPGYRTVEREIEVTATAPTEVSVDLERK